MRKCLEPPSPEMLNAKGLGYERIAAELLKRKGYTVAWDVDHSVWAPDLFVAPAVPIEVKGSRLHVLSNGRLGFQFLIYKAGRSKPIREPVVMLLCCPDPDSPRKAVPFFIPTPLLGGVHNIAIPQADPWLYAGKWEKFRGNYAALGNAGARKGAKLCQVQLALPL